MNGGMPQFPQDLMDRIGRWMETHQVQQLTIHKVSGTSQVKGEYKRFWTGELTEVK